MDSAATTTALPSSAASPASRPAGPGIGRPAGFAARHIGPSPADEREMLDALGLDSLDALVNAVVPADILLDRDLDLPAAASEPDAIGEIRAIAAKNRVFTSLIGQGYSDCITPPVIQRNILENPGWYTQYTPYQAEISQGRLEALLNFQTMVCDLTGLEIANASLLDEPTAAAEAMAMCHRVCKNPDAASFFVAGDCHPQTIEVVRTRARPLGINVIVGDAATFQPGPDLFAALVQFPGTDGKIADHGKFVEAVHAVGALVAVATDLLALALLRPPGEWGADVVVGNSQRFGVGLGYGGPHAAFFATRDQFKRSMPGRVVGLSKDAAGRPAYRLAMQTREQHIRRDKATSNICTAQVLLAVMASMYAVYHGPGGLRAIARAVHEKTLLLAASLRRLGFAVQDGPFFDTIHITTNPERARDIHRAAAAQQINLRKFSDSEIGISLDETTSSPAPLLAIFGGNGEALCSAPDECDAIPPDLARRSSFLEHPVFNRYHTETELLRYIRRLESRDLSLTTSMIPLGSCTMKLNATTEMLPVTWPEFARLHPFAPADQAAGYHQLFTDLEAWLAEITGLPATSLQPNAGSQGEYAGLLAIRAWHLSRNEPHRKVCLIPVSAHGTNPASAIMAGFQVVPVACDAVGNVDISDLTHKAEEHAHHLAALMVTYPSTHGVFESGIRRICKILHDCGGLVYMDGANLNAQVALCRPGDIGADVCHLNLHKTFCIPHGGGGPGMGPICVAERLRPFLPGHATAFPANGTPAVGAVSGSPAGSASILVISWLYIRMMGAAGLRKATQSAILNANYIAHRLASRFPILYTGEGGFVAHECILDCRPWKERAGVEVEDIAKRLMDYGFHAPTMSWPVAGTLMVEPTESESKAELDRFCEAMIAIHDEIRAIESGRSDPADNPLKHAPHPAQDVISDAWSHAYSREQAAFPAPWTREHKFWPVVSRIDNVFGDRHLVCSCPTVEELALS